MALEYVTTETRANRARAKTFLREKAYFIGFDYIEKTGVVKDGFMKIKKDIESCLGCRYDANP